MSRKEGRKEGRKNERRKGKKNNDRQEDGVKSHLERDELPAFLLYPISQRSLFRDLFRPK